MDHQPYTSFDVCFTTAAQAEQGFRRLEAAGFTIERADGDATLTASMPGDVDAIGAKLDAAVAGLRHDPVLAWQTTRLNGFTP